MRSSIREQVPLRDHQAARAKRFNGCHIVADKNDGPATRADVTHFSQAAFLKGRIAHGQNFIDEQDLRLEKSGHRKSQAKIHSARIPFHRHIDETFHLREGNDFIELRGDLRALHAENGSVQKHIFSSGKLLVETSPHFQKTADSTVQIDPSCGGFRDARQDFEQSGFTRAVAPDDANHLTLSHVE